LKVIGAAIQSGSTDVPVTTQMKVGNKIYEPFGAFNSPLGGKLNDGNNPRDYASPDTFQQSEKISVAGRSWLGSETQDSDFNSYLTIDSSSGSNNVFVLRDGDDVPNVSGYNGQSSAEEFLKPYIDSDTDKITLKKKQVIFLFELGTTNLSSTSADFQDLVTLVTMRRASYAPLTEDEKEKLRQVIGMLMNADESLAVCTINEATCAEGRQSDLDTANKYLMDGRASESNEEFMSASVSYAQGWSSAMDSVDWKNIDTSASFAAAMKPAPPSTWVAPTGDLTLTTTRVTGNASGVVVSDSQPVTVHGATISANQTWGIQIKGQLVLESSTVASNGEGGLLLRDTQSGDLTVTNVKLTDNLTYGVFFENPTLTVDQSLHSGWTIFRQQLRAGQPERYAHPEWSDHSRRKRRRCLHPLGYPERAELDTLRQWLWRRRRHQSSDHFWVDADS
jgi:hypothetical protein